jgi:predicted nucleic acid-binding protein
VSLVLDASLALAWYFQDQTTSATDTILDRVAETGAVVPALWRLEIANGLQVAVRRGRISVAYRDASLAELTQMQIDTDSETDVHAWSATLRLAEKHELTLYDAAYLELAQRRRLPLATLDRELRRAADKLSVTVLGPH